MSNKKIKGGMQTCLDASSKKTRKQKAFIPTTLQRQLHFCDMSTQSESLPMSNGLGYSAEPNAGTSSHLKQAPMPAGSEDEMEIRIEFG